MATAPMERPPDIFLSHSREDRRRALQVIQALEKAGYNVWWDGLLEGGTQFTHSTESALEGAAVVVVLWSKYSASSHWVRDEATRGRDRGCLLPLGIDGTEPPLGFRQYQVIDLSRWRGQADAPAFAPVLQAAKSCVARRDAGGTAATARDAHDAGGPQAPRNRTGAFRLSIAALVLVVAGAGWWAVHRRSTDTTVAPALPAAATTAAVTGTQSAAGSANSRPRIAVLPFENLSSDPGNAFFTDGMHEEILTALANGIPGVDVISRTTMNTYKGKSIAVEALARDLNCRYALEGSVRREGNTMRLTLQLIDAHNDSHVWAQNFDRKLVNAMAIESEVASAVARQLSTTFSGTAPATSAAAADPVAFDLYLKARASDNFLGSGPPSLGQWQAAGQLLDQSIARDATFVRAYVERIGIRANLLLRNLDTSEANLRAAHQDLDTIRRLAPQDPLLKAAESILAFAEMDYDHALQSFELVEKAGLSDSRLLEWKLELLSAMGRYTEGIALAHHLVDLDPKNVRAQEQWWFMLMGYDGKEALRIVDLRLATEPTNEMWQQLRATALFEIGGDLDPRAAIADKQLSAARRAPQDWETGISNLGYWLRQAHRYVDNRDVIDALKVDTTLKPPGYSPVARVGPTPRAVERGWLDLLLGDKTEAARDGRRILSFLSSEPETRWNRWYRELLRAQAQLFMGDGASALVTADAAVAMTLARPDINDQANAYAWATQIMAWAGKKEEAATRLEQLSKSPVTGLWPGEIARNPIWTVPLATSPTYQKLRDRLNAQMRAVNFQ